MRACSWRSTSCSAGCARAATASPTCATSPTSTTRSSAARWSAANPIAALTERNIEAMHEDFDALGIARPDIEPRATQYMRADARPHRHARAPAAWPIAPTTATSTSRCALPELRQAVGPVGRRTAQRRTHRRQPGQARPARLRPLEAPPEPDEAAVGLALGSGPAGLAHRVLGDGRGHPRRRSFDIHGGGPDLHLPAPRERDRAKRGRVRRAAGAAVDALRRAAHGRTRRCPSRWATSSRSARC